MSVSAATTLPLADRGRAIHYEKEDGRCGELAFPINYEELYNLKGRLLTVADAVTTDAVQRKALKDVIWTTLQAWMNDIECGGSAPVVPFGASGQCDEVSPAA